ncbi:MAG: ArsR/SmtB family transcription factor [Micromonosporaceae bacterium]
MTTQPRTPYTVRDPKVMRAMAHPARMAILQHLGEGAETTATECAEICGLSPSATSYHLRALAKIGLVEEAPSRGDGRERVWRSPVRGFMLDLDDPDVPDAVPAALALVDVVLQRDEAVLRRWLEKAHEIAQDDSDAVILHRSQIVVTPAELEELRAEILKMFEPYTPTQRQEPPAGARKVITLFRAFPADPP